MQQKFSNEFIFTVLYEQGLKQLELQASSVESIEAKTGYLMAGEGVVLTLLVTFATQSKGFAPNLEIYIGIGLLLLSIFCNIFALWNRHLKVGLGIKDFYTSFLSKGEDDIRVNALNIVNYAYEVNRITILKKSRWFQFALVGFGVSLILLVVGLSYNYVAWYNQNMTQDKPQSVQIHSGSQNNNHNGHHSIPSQQGQTFQWSSPNQNLGTIAADVIKSSQDNTNINK